MPKKTSIRSICFNFPGDILPVTRFNETCSLLDDDLIVIDPEYSDYGSRTKTENGLFIDIKGSERLLKDRTRWREDIGVSLQIGKTVIIFLSSGQDELHVTTKVGTSPLTTRQNLQVQYTPIGALEFLPVERPLVKRNPDSLLKVVKHVDLLSAYWKEFEQYSYMDGYIADPNLEGAIVTKSGGFTVGAVLHLLEGKLVILPPLDFDRLRKENGVEWKDDAKAVGHALSAALIGIHNALKGEDESLPPPSWLTKSPFKTKREAAIELSMQDVAERISKLTEQLGQERVRLDEACKAKKLLYGKGHQLNDVVLKALRAMGFEADSFCDSTSEFDVVAKCPEGRFLGEVEGKDNQQVSTTKLDQLERNIREEFSKNEGTEYLKGVLFGNGYRLTEPSKRGIEFTEKCIAGAKRSQIALVQTSDLYAPAEYLSTKEDPTYAKKCREAILSAAGSVVIFPTPVLSVDECFVPTESVSMQTPSQVHGT